MGELVHSQDDPKQLPAGSNHIDKKKKAASIVTPQRKNNMKPRDSKRDTSVSFEEVQRIMQVYGPIKAGRNRRKINHIGKMVKPESIKRKFYRWFPDFNERFIKAPDGFFTPNIGHLQEIKYREVMRAMDQELLVKKRSNTRYLPPMYHMKRPTFIKKYANLCRRVLYAIDAMKMCVCLCNSNCCFLWACRSYFAEIL